MVVSVSDSSMQSTANMEEGASPLLGPHPPPPLLPEALLGEVATPGPQCGQLILATFHRKPDLRDRAGRKQVGVEPGNREGWHRTFERGGRG
jgi:hypothetical protein